MRRAVTLVELLVATALAVVIVGLVAWTSAQVQTAIHKAMVRQDAVRLARMLLDDIERDLDGLVPLARPTGALDQPPLRLELCARGPDEGEGDGLTVLTTIRGGDRLRHGYVRYALGEPFELPGGGPRVAPLLRTTRVPDAEGDDAGPRVLAPAVVAFEIEWQGAAGGRFLGRGDEPATLSDFGHSGTVDITVDSTGQTALDPRRAEFLADASVVPIGGEVHLVGGTPPLAPTRVLVRRRLEHGEVLVTERLVDAVGVGASAFAPPPMVRVSLVLPFGAGADLQTATFSRCMAVPR